MDEVSVDVSAPPEKIWGLLSDISQMGRWSPECYRCEWLDGATGPKPGARFKGWNKRGLMRWSTVSTVVAAEQPAELAWEVADSGMRWTYRLTPSGAGTTVSEAREATRPLPLKARLAYKLRLLGKDPDAIVVAGMRETLQRVKAAAET